MAQTDHTAIINGDTLRYRYTPDDTPPHSSTVNRGACRFFTQSLNNSHKELQYGTRFMVIGGPGYSAETNFRLALMGRMMYRTRRTPLETTPSYTAISATASISGYYRFALDGCHIFNQQHRIMYGGELRSLPTRIWGLTYNESLHNSQGRYTSKRYMIWGGYRYNISRRLFAGINIDYQYFKALKLDNRALTTLDHKPLSLSTASIGATIGYDSRDSEINALRGIYAAVEGTFHPSLLSNIAFDVWRITATFDYFQPLWRGATLAFDVYGEFNTPQTPWMLRSQLGSESRMRGYYTGRFNGDNIVVAQIELRQHIWQGLSCAVWGGAGEAFSYNDDFKWNKILPNYGIGIRWSNANRACIRIDAGFGRDAFSIIVALNEAF